MHAASAAVSFVWLQNQRSQLKMNNSAAHLWLRYMLNLFYTLFIACGDSGAMCSLTRSWISNPDKAPSRPELNQIAGETKMSRTS